MNQHLKTLLNFIQQSKDLSASERNKILAEVKKIEDEILHKSRELEIEAALEKVRAVAMRMKQAADMIEICRIISKRLQMLNLKNLRNVQTAIIDKSKGIYSHYEYYTLYNQSSVSEVKYNEHPKVLAFVNEIRKARDAFFTTTFKVAELKKWRNHRKDQNLVPDPKLDEVDRIYYYYYSVGPGALGVSTYVPLKKEEINLFKRFRNVFDLAYKRYTDIEKAEAQARQAQIEASLEKVRSKAMSMQKSEDLANAVAIVFEELDKLNLGMLRCGIGITDKKKRTADLWTTTKSDKGMVVQVSGDESMDIHPLLQGEFDAWLKQEDYTYLLQGKDLNNFYTALAAENYRLPDSQYIKKKTEGLQQYYYVVNFPAGGLYAFRETPFTEEAITVLRRFADVFNLTYTRFNDLKQAEAQAREAQIEVSLERVRGKAMAMHNSTDLTEAAGTVFTELNKLGINPIRTGFVLLTHQSRNAKLYPATSFDKEHILSFTGEFEFTGHPVFEKQYESWEKKENYFPVLEGDVLKSYYQILSVALSVPYKNFPTDKKQFGSFLPFTEGFLFTWSEEPYSEKEINILERFKVILNLTITRFLDLQNAEAQTREAKIESALERVRSKAMAMHKSDDLNAAVAIVFEELDKLNLGMLRCGIGILSKEKRCADVWTTTIAEEGHIAQVMGDESIDIHPLLQGAFDAWERQKDFSYVLEGEDLNRYYNAVSKVNFKLPDSQSITATVEGLKQYYYVTAFQAGNLYAFRETPFSDEAKTVMKRFAGVFNLTYKRFLDIQKAEAQAIEAQLQKQLIETKHREITENISYALRIQTAILPDEKLVKEYLQDSFVLYLPKDVVAGDFYWMLRLENMILFSANDCTGHGVSGAMVSVFCHNALNRAIREYNLTQPSLILDKVAELVEENFTQSEDKIQDGMDTSLCALHLPSPLERGKGVRLQWAGANNPLWIVRNNELLEHKPDKQPIGKYENRKPYTNHEIELQQGDNIYIFSDGYQDQFGGEKGKKLTKKGFKNILLSIHEKNMDAQYEALLNYHYEWKGKEEQVDDICILGVKI